MVLVACTTDSTRHARVVHASLYDEVHEVAVIKSRGKELNHSKKVDLSEVKLNLDCLQVGLAGKQPSQLSFIVRFCIAANSWPLLGEFIIWGSKIADEETKQNMTTVTVCRAEVANVIGMENRSFMNVPAVESVKALTQKLGRQSLEEEVAPHLLKNEDHDSGTESDKENSENDSCPHCSPMPLRAQNIFTPPISNNNNKRPFQPLNQSRSSSHLLSWQQDKPRCYRVHDSTESQVVLSDFFLSNCSSCISDLDDYSSEDELSSINCEDDGPMPRVGGKRSWSKVNCRSVASNSSGIIRDAWSDEGLQEEASPMPLNFSASPPKGIGFSHTLSPKVFLASVLPASSPCIATWKKPR
ncbi:hypothetical protein CAPTEDRAFT_227760 [Capitella teleta]|uniref:Uncharacterized protein n=1 Tax=Capitella teleta TaxID=283909 RepID=R7TH84_CAPTE|nr:hypothetical protein CAPTEDRAFT_227760 [Capitella teleta]|eukprot:ELT93074.1 hypothetical protein CAPTEDRAFT_227760 [Capitella teleta]